VLYFFHFGLESSDFHLSVISTEGTVLLLAVGERLEALDEVFGVYQAVP
jgi:hypothetical protein